ncbi:hypothetical protein MCEMSEM23_01797 [Rhabdaerophilaceae bacterium]
MKSFRLKGLALALLVAAGPVLGAEAWNIPHEKIAVLKGRIVDVLCTLKNDCPADCGAGRRQLGLLQADGKLRLIAKGNVDFAGAVVDLQPFCGQEVELDGLLVENPAITLFFAQGLRSKPQDAFAPVDKFLSEWTKRNGPAAEWWRKDPTANALIAEDGPFGIKGLMPAPK